MKQIIYLTSIAALLFSCESPTKSSQSNTKLKSPEITLNPIPLTIQEGAPALFTVTAAGDSLQYQWKRNSEVIPYATHPYFKIDKTEKSDNNSAFSVMVYNSGDTVISTSALLSVISNSAPHIVKHPADVTVEENSAFTFSVRALGESLTYQWRVNETEIAFARSSELTLSSISISDNGSKIDCIVSNSDGADTSDVAILTVKEKSEIFGLMGIVINKEGGPVPNATVKLFAFRENSQVEKYSVRTTADGHYQLENVTPETYSLLITDENSAYFNDSIEIYEDKLTQRSDTIKKTRDIYIPVKIEKQHNVQMATAHVLGSDISGKANRDFYIKLQNMPEANMSITFKMPLDDYTPTLKRIQITEESDTLTDTVSIIYTGIPIVTGISAGYDELTGIASVDWKKSESLNVQSYNIYREGSSEKVLIGRVDKETFNFTDKLREEHLPDGTYHYSVSITNSSGETGKTFGSVSVEHRN